ncbi:MAG: hypothetical protein OXF44_12845 [Anaerolineaceae bacterium]|nr:hypothetical protein [Anaerolineaceae bacterium]
MKEEHREDLEAELKASLADFIDHQQRALSAAGRACDAWGTPAFESHARVAGATSLAGLRRLLRNVADVAADCEAAGYCGGEADSGVDRQGPATGGNQDGVRVRVRVNGD